MEALIGAVAADRGWDWEILTNVVDRLLRLQLDFPDQLLKKSYYDRFNAWHQKRFGIMPEYETKGETKGTVLFVSHRSEKMSAGICGNAWPYRCTIRFFVPENDQGIPIRQRIEAEGTSRSACRELAAELAFRFVTSHGLWISLKDAKIQPDLENSINQLQELWQKKYLDTLPEYTFREAPSDQWCCTCACAGLLGFGMGENKTKAKKKAAFSLLQSFLQNEA